MQKNKTIVAKSFITLLTPPLFRFSDVTAKRMPITTCVTESFTMNLHQEEDKFIVTITDGKGSRTGRLLRHDHYTKSRLDTDNFKGLAFIMGVKIDSIQSADHYVTSQFNGSDTGLLVMRDQEGKIKGQIFISAQGNLEICALIQ